MPLVLVLATVRNDVASQTDDEKMGRVACFGSLVVVAEDVYNLRRFKRTAAIRMLK